MWNYLTVNTVSECLCLAAAVAFVGRDKTFAWRCMPLFLLFTCAAELIGIYIYSSTSSQNNHWLYNGLLVFQVLFTHIMYFYLLAPYRKYKLMLLVGIGLLVMNYSYDMLTAGIFKFSVHTYTMLAVLNILYGLVYYYLKLNDDERYENLLYSAGFWWVAGNLFFSFGSTVSNLFDDQLYSIKLNGHHLTFYIFRGLDIILYGFWTYAFYCRRWKNLA